ncbi:hypothetical protein FQR65_LT20963 [Abscondita terminalis]|nr:hypothetical protein FQR65_LT20963 [Abscondita terminalis]
MHHQMGVGDALGFPDAVESAAHCQSRLVKLCRHRGWCPMAIGRRRLGFLTKSPPLSGSVSILAVEPSSPARFHERPARGGGGATVDDTHVVSRVGRGLAFSAKGAVIITEEKPSLDRALADISGLVRGLGAMHTGMWPGTLRRARE